MTDGVAGSLARLAEAWRPRILTQLCRDPGSPFYGCADRNWWHYKIRDFPSIILQQAGYANYLAGCTTRWQSDREALNHLAAASARFWNGRARRHGAFEEYYPYEQGYPPLAFSTLAVAKLAGEGVVPLADVAPGLRIAARQLRTRFEGQAANQQMAGLAALAWIDRLLPDDADAACFAQLKARTLELQTVEGWFWEYDGPDLGYLSVTLDCLWDLFDATEDPQFRAAIAPATAFMAQVCATLPQGAGQLNARNTDYLAPYGIVRAALEGDGNAAVVAAIAFARADAPDHAFAAIDDRYLCHYLGQSVMRACLMLETGGELPAPAHVPADAQLLPESGLYLDGSAGLAVACRKGGVVIFDNGAAGEFGWIVERRNRQHVSHWWSSEWTFEEREGALHIGGALFAHRERAATPARHMALRLLSFVLGRRLIGGLKRALIFKRGGSGLRLERQVRITGDSIRIIDRIAGLAPSDRLQRAPRASKRHVASAASFHAQDLVPLGAARLEERSTKLADGRVEIRTRLELPPR